MNDHERKGNENIKQWICFFPSMNSSSQTKIELLNIQITYEIRATLCTIESVHLRDRIPPALAPVASYWVLDLFILFHFFTSFLEFQSDSSEKGEEIYSFIC